MEVTIPSKKMVNESEIDATSKNDSLGNCIEILFYMILMIQWAFWGQGTTTTTTTMTTWQHQKHTRTSHAKQQ